jgi:DNA-binding NarL/FixJ family response regulator
VTHARILARILIVEDEVLVAIANAEILEDLGYRVIGMAVSHEEAVDQAATAIPDLVLMDIRLKGAVDGIVSAGILKERHGCRVLFVTGQGDATTRERAAAVGPAGYLRKPFTPGQLADAVAAALAWAPLRSG